MHLSHQVSLSGRKSRESEYDLVSNLLELSSIEIVELSLTLHLPIDV